jgi:LemA protein
MSKGLKFGCIGVVVVLVLLLIIGYSAFKNTYNKMVTLDESVNNSWAQVENVLQRRMDLIPNLVETVKGYASFERETLEAVIQARANATKTQINAESLMENPQMMNQYLESQNQLSSALSRLMVVVERYPDLKANQNFLRLQDELAGTENRIAVERRRYNDTVREYNQTLRQFPTNIIAGFFGFETRPYFEAPEEAQQAPRVEFN